MAAYSGPLRLLVLERDGFMCVRCPRARQATDVHHRRPRGMGGSTRAHTNCPCNLIALCRACHLEVESERDQSFTQGFLVPQKMDGKDVPMTRRGKVVFLTCEGYVRSA